MDNFEIVLEYDGSQLTRVAEPTMYPSEFPVFLRKQLEGRTVTEAASLLEISPVHVRKLLDGHWRPSRQLCRKLGLKTVYTVGQAGLIETPSKRDSLTQ